MSLLEVRGLQVWYDLPDGRRAHAVQGVDLTIERLQRVGLIGESGCGKTTALLAMMGLLPATATVGGEVLLDGEDLIRGGEEMLRRRRWTDIAMVFQGTMNALSPVHTVGAQIVEPMELHGTESGAGASRRAGELLERVGLSAGAARRYPHELSGGMRQRVGIAMALACAPRVLLADEPTTALDVITQAQVLDLLVELADEAGLALVLVTHDLPVMAQVCQHAAVMYAGEVVEEGPTESLYESPRHPYTRRLLAATPTLYGSRSIASIPGTPPRLDRPIVGCPFAPRCQRAFERCRHERPRLRPMEPAHAAACHHVHAAHDSQAQEGGETAAAGLAPATPTSSYAARQRNSDAPSRSVEGNAPLLEVGDLVVRYALRRSMVRTLLRRPREVVDAVDGVSLRLERGEMLALVGESGAGKTTVAHAITRLVDSESGSIHLAGRDIGSLRPRDVRPLRRRVQLIYQDPYESLDPRFRVRDLVAEPLIVHESTSKTQRTERVLEALARTGLTPPDSYLDRYPHELSGGQRQRAAIAASLVLEPELLVADEPVSMLDVSARAGVLELLDGLRGEERMGIIMITHDLSTAAQFADRIAVMYRGRIVEEGPARTVINAPQHDYTTALLRAVPKIPPSSWRTTERSMPEQR